MLDFTNTAMSNTERQRLFREANPGYYARLQATRRAAAKRGVMARSAALRAMESAAGPIAEPSPAAPVVPAATTDSAAA